MAYLDNWDEKFATVKPRKLLALDGGGICGVVSLEVLRKIEKDLAAATGKGASFRLGDFFDYIAGTSTGSRSQRPVLRSANQFRSWLIFIQTRAVDF